MRAIAQYTITNLCDVITSDIAPAEPYVGQLWVNTAAEPPETLVWDGLSWSVQNDLVSLRTSVSVNTTRVSELQSTADGMNSYVASLTETVETVSGTLAEEQTKVLEAQTRISELTHSLDGLSAQFEEQYAGGINFICNSAGLNGISDDWTYAGTVSAIQGTDTKNNTVSDSCFQLAAYSTLTQIIDGIVPGQSYRLTVKAKKASSYNAYIRATFNGSATVDLFNTSGTFPWTEYSAILPDVQDSVITVTAYSRDASLFVSDFMLSEGVTPHKWTPAPNEIYTSEVKIDRRGIEVTNGESSQRTVITNTEFSGYYNDDKIFSLNKDETLTKKTVVDGELTVGKTKFIPTATASDGLNIVILD